MRILVCGDRHWDDDRTIRAVLTGLEVNCPAGLLNHVVCR